MPGAELHLCGGIRSIGSGFRKLVEQAHHPTLHRHRGRGKNQGTHHAFLGILCPQKYPAPEHQHPCRQPPEGTLLARHAFSSAGVALPHSRPAN